MIFRKDLTFLEKNLMIFRKKLTAFRKNLTFLEKNLTRKGVYLFPPLMVCWKQERRRRNLSRKPLCLGRRALTKAETLEQMTKYRCALISPQVLRLRFYDDPLYIIIKEYLLWKRPPMSYGMPSSDRR